MENLLLTPGMLGIDSPTVGWLIQLAVAGILLALLLVAADAESVPSARTACLGREIVGHGTRCRAVGHVTAFAIGIFGYVALVAVLDRFWSATVIGALLIILLWAGNKLKVAILKEPLSLGCRGDPSRWARGAREADRRVASRAGTRSFSAHGRCLGGARMVTASKQESSVFP